MAGELILRALGHVWVTLQALRVPAALMGGVALAAWRYVRATQDVDLLVGIDELDLDRVLKGLAEAGVKARRQPPTRDLGHVRIVQLAYEPEGALMELHVDLFLAESEFARETLERRIMTQLPQLDLEVAVLRCEDLVLHKLAAGRVLDLADAAALLRANNDSLDWELLWRAAADLNVTGELEQARSSAFP